MSSQSGLRSLRRWSWCGAVSLLLCCGCPAVEGPAGIGGDSPDSAARLAMLDHARQMLASIELDGSEENNQKIADILRSMSEFESVMVYDDSVLARFSDGPLLIVLNNRGDSDLPDGGEPSDKQLQSGIERAKSGRRATLADRSKDAYAALDKSNRIPDSRSALMINAMGTGYRDSTGLFGLWLSQAGYDVTQVDATVEGLRNGVHDVGVLYMSAHGAPIPASIRPQGLDESYFASDSDTPRPTVPFPVSDGNDHFALWTRTVVSNETIAQYRDDINKGMLTFGLAAVDKVDGRTTKELHFMITEAFVRQYWRCSPGAVLYIDACSSANALIVNACLGSEVNASAYIGWTRPVYDKYSTPTARYYFDRVLGANQLEPVRSPPQRPFSTNNVIGAMHELVRFNLPLDQSPVPKSIIRVEDDSPPPTPDSATESQLVVLYSDDTSDLLLLPTISNLTAFDSQNRLAISGQFGDTPGKVMIDGTELTVRDGGWASDRVECDLPQSGAGSSGTVVVTSLDRDSNPRRLTQWDLTLRRLFMDFPTQASVNCPDCFYEATLNYTIRADTGGVRTVPEGAVHPSSYTGGAVDSSIEVTNAGGSFTLNQDAHYTVTLSPNSGNEATATGTCIGFLPPNDNFVGACFFLNESEHVINFSPTFQALALIQSYTSSSGGSLDGVYPYTAIYSGNLTNNTLILEISPNFNIVAGNQTTGANSYFEWDGANALHPAEPDDKR